MIIYQLLLHESPDNINKIVKFVDDTDLSFVEIVKRDDVEGLEVDYIYMKSEYNIEIAKTAITCFATHRLAWEAFNESSDNCCLIIEDKAVPQVPISSCKKYLEDLPEDWDIFFPFDKSLHDMSAFEQPSVLGYYWGSHVYFLSKQGVKKLLAIKIIKQDIDEEILECSLKGILNVFMNDTRQFIEAGYNKLSVNEQKQKAVRDVIFNTNVWTKAEKEKARQILRVVSDLANKHGIELVLDSGSLLGSIRHGGIMAWDDDMDLSIEKSQAEKLILLIKNESRLLCSHTKKEDLVNDPIKIWMNDGDIIEGMNHRFPFLDLWIYTIGEKNVVFYEGRIFPYKDFYPLKNEEFEGAMFKVPANATNCLHNQYKGWDRKIEIYQWCHRKEKASFIPLQTNINVDKNGRILSEP